MHVMLYSLHFTYNNVLNPFGDTLFYDTALGIQVRDHVYY